MSVAERLRQEGIQQGIKQGIQEAKKIVAKRLIIGGYSTERIANITELTDKDIEEIREEMLESIGDFSFGFLFFFFDWESKALLLVFSILFFSPNGSAS